MSDLARDEVPLTVPASPPGTPITGGEADSSKNEEIREALRYAFEGRESHVLWAEHLAGEPCVCGSCTPEALEHVGTLESQREWVRKYDVIIRALTYGPALHLLLEGVAQIGNEEGRKRSVRFATRLLTERAANAALTESVVGLSADVTRLEGERDDAYAKAVDNLAPGNRTLWEARAFDERRLREGAEVRVKELEQQTESEPPKEREDSRWQGARELLCGRCARDYPVWWAPNEVWNAVVRSHGGAGYGTEPNRDVFLCPLCFVMLAEEREPESAPTGWFVTPEGLGPDVFLRTIRERDDALAELQGLRDTVRGGNCIRDDEGRSPCERQQAALEQIALPWHPFGGPGEHAKETCAICIARAALAALPASSVVPVEAGTGTNSAASGAPDGGSYRCQACDRALAKNPRGTAGICTACGGTTELRPSQSSFVAHGDATRNPGCCAANGHPWATGDGTRAASAAPAEGQT